jgi:uncharacterized membrane protein YkvA (DUF1232 family)
MTTNNNRTPALPPSNPSEPPGGRFRGLAASIRQAILQARLVWRLFRDRRIPWWLKAIPLGGLAYVIFPLDLIPDFAPVVGQMDDLGIFMASAWLFVDLCPKAIVQEHWQSLTGAGNGSEEKASQTVVDVTPRDPPE